MIEKITLKNFKAIHSASVTLTDFSVFVGNNGSGKSSLIEALQTLQNVLWYGISTAFTERWYGLEKIQNQQAQGKAIFIGIQGKMGKDKYRYEVSFNATANQDLYFVEAEKLYQGKRELFHLTNAPFSLDKQSDSFSKRLADYIKSWQFLTLAPETMFKPTCRNQGSLNVRMDSSGENLADFFSRLQDSPSQLHLILEKMRYVLPELTDLTAKHDNLRKEVFLQMLEKSLPEPLASWLLSTGTLRILAMLALFNGKEVPPVTFIEEIENGLDPRTLNLLVAEIRGILGEHQVITTTHSPYFLDLVDLRHLIVAERNQGQTEYFRPADNEKLKAWKNEFSAGQLYLMDRLTKS